jgi:hypothetical protein
MLQEYGFATTVLRERFSFAFSSLFCLSVLQLLLATSALLSGRSIFQSDRRAQFGGGKAAGLACAGGPAGGAAHN